MGSLVAAGASSHAFALEEPTGWDERRERNRRRFVERFGYPPPDPPGLEDDADLFQRARRVADGFAQLRDLLAAAAPDLLVLVGDDQDECFPDGNFPQVAVYLGGGFSARGARRDDPARDRPGDATLAGTLYEALVENDVDAMALSTLPEGHLAAHAFGPLLDVIDPAARIPVVPVFVNAIHPPTPSPGRCYRIGQLLRQAVDGRLPEARVAVYGSGGLSHFPASYPCQGDGRPPFPWGHIDEAFDRWVLDRLAAGDGAALSRLAPADLREHGAIELNSWLVVLGAVGAARPQLLVYDALYRGMMGMGVAYWGSDR